jgi:predicted enzyme related to lactoylglutathione lyase
MKPIVAAVAIVVTGPFFASAQAPRQGQQTEPPVPFIMNLLPVTDNLDRAEEFYHRLLGLESAIGDPRARLIWYPQNPFLDDMYGVKGNTRNFFLRVPGSDLNLEIEQFSAATGKKLDTHIQDPGAVQLIFNVNDIDLLTGWLTKGGAKALTAGGKPVGVLDELGNPSHAILFQDFNGFFVKLIQRDGSAKPLTGPLPPYIGGVTIGVTVDDTEKTARFYHEVLGLEVTGFPFAVDEGQLEAFGLKGAQYRESKVAFPEKTPQLHFFEFKGVERKPLHPGVADPNSVLIRIAVRDMDAVVAQVKAAGGQIMNGSGGPTINGKNKWLIVTDPNGIHLQLVDRNSVQ